MHPIVGSEEVAAGRLTRAALRWNYTAVHPNVYVLKGATLSPYARIESAFLWTQRKGIVAGRAAAHMYGVHGALTSHDIEVIARHRRRMPGVTLHDERIGDDEINHGAVLMTSPARTALDLGRRLPHAEAVPLLDALAAKSGVTVAEVDALAARYPGMRGLPAARDAVGLMDGGAQSREESVIRLSLVKFGLPRPTTDIHVEDKQWSARIAMGWERVKVGVSFEPEGVAVDTLAVQRFETEELLQRLGWLHIRAHPRRTLHSVRRQARDALVSRGYLSRRWLPTSSAAGR